jgi:hypothetical protein
VRRIEPFGWCRDKGRTTEAVAAVAGSGGMLAGPTARLKNRGQPPQTRACRRPGAAAKFRTDSQPQVNRIVASAMRIPAGPKGRFGGCQHRPGSAENSGMEGDRRRCLQTRHAASELARDGGDRP